MSFNPVRHQPGQFVISGILHPGNEGEFLIRVEPGYRIAMPFYIPISGYLPNARESEFWRVECKLEDRRLFMVDAQKLRNAFVAPTIRPKKPRQRKPGVVKCA